MSKLCAFMHVCVHACSMHVCMCAQCPHSGMTICDQLTIRDQRNVSFIVCCLSWSTFMFPVLVELVKLGITSVLKLIRGGRDVQAARGCQATPERAKRAVYIFED